MSQLLTTLCQIKSKHTKTMINQKCIPTQKFQIKFKIYFPEAFSLKIRT